MNETLEIEHSPPPIPTRLEDSDDGYSLDGPVASPVSNITLPRHGLCSAPKDISLFLFWCFVLHAKPKFFPSPLLKVLKLPRVFCPNRDSEG